VLVDEVKFTLVTTGVAGVAIVLVGVLDGVILAVNPEPATRLLRVRGDPELQIGEISEKVERVQVLGVTTVKRLVVVPTLDQLPTPVMVAKVQDSSIRQSGSKVGGVEKVEVPIAKTETEFSSPRSLASTWCAAGRAVASELKTKIMEKDKRAKIRNSMLKDVWASGSRICRKSVLIVRR
jgi:hypothetical protein